MSFFLKGWIETLVEKLDDSEAKKKLNLKPHSIFTDFDRRLRIAIESAARIQKSFPAYAPIRETPQRVYLHESGTLNAHDARGERTATRLMKLSQGTSPA